MKNYLFVFLIYSILSGQDCTSSDGTDGIELWDYCYSIDNTTEINLGNMNMDEFKSILNNSIKKKGTKVN